MKLHYVGSRGFIKAATLACFILVGFMPSAYILLAEFDPVSYSALLEPRHAEIFFRTILLGAGVSLLSLSLGITAAFLLECTDLPLRNWFSTLILIPLLLPPYITTIAWMMILGKAGNWFNVAVPFSIYNIQTVIVLMSLSYFPLISLLVSYAIRNVDFRLEEAGRQLYSPLTVFRKITLPLVSPHIAISALFVFMLTISEYGTPSLLQVNVYMTEIFAEFSAFFNMGNAAALSVPLLLVAVIIMMLMHERFKNGSYVTISSFSRRRNVIVLTGWQKILGTSFMSTLVAFSAAIPLGFLLMISQNRFAEAVDTAGGSFINSFWLACVSAVLLAAIGFLIAYFYRRLSDPLVLFPMAIPSAIVALGLIKMWNSRATSFIYATPAILLLGYLARFIPFVAKTFSPFFTQINASIEETARLSGAPFTSILRKITIPLMKPAMIPALAVGFVLSLRELEVSLLVTPPGFQTLPNRIYTLIHYGDYGLVSALCIMLVALIIGPIAMLIAAKRAIKWVSSNSKE